MVQHADTVLVVNLRQVVTAEKNTMQQSQTRIQAISNSEAMVEDAIETMVVMPRGPQVVTFDSSIAAQTKDTPDITTHGVASHVVTEDLEYGDTSSRQLTSSLRPSTRGQAAAAAAAATPTTAMTLGDYSKYEKPSKLRTSILSTVGVLLMVGGIVWAIVHVIESPDYVTTTTGQPAGAVLCSKLEKELTSPQIAAMHNDTDLASYADCYQEQCQIIPDQYRPCTFAVSYTFSTPTVEEEIGCSTLQFDSGGECHESVDESRQFFLQSTNFTIYYNTNDPSDNYYHPTTEAGTVAGIIAGISCAVGMLFVCVSLLERILI
jgi:hypothetical protein